MKNKKLAVELLIYVAVVIISIFVLLTSNTNKGIEQEDTNDSSISNIQ